MSPFGIAGKVHNRVREIRQLAGLTQDDLANRIGLTRQTINAIERGRFTPSIYSVLHISKALQVKVEQLFWIEE